MGYLAESSKYRKLVEAQQTAENLKTCIKNGDTKKAAMELMDLNYRLRKLQFKKYIVSLAGSLELESNKSAALATTEIVIAAVKVEKETTLKALNKALGF